MEAQIRYEPSSWCSECKLYIAPLDGRCPKCHNPVEHQPKHWCKTCNNYFVPKDGLCPTCRNPLPHHVEEKKTDIPPPGKLSEKLAEVTRRALETEHPSVDYLTANLWSTYIALVKHEGDRNIRTILEARDVKNLLNLRKNAMVIIEDIRRELNKV